MLSRLNSGKSLNQICHQKIEHVIENEVRKNPYMAWVSKNQLLWNNGLSGQHWKETEGALGKSLLDHAGVTRPSFEDLDVQVRRYGYCMEFPPRELPPILNNIVRSLFIKPMLLGKKYTDIRFLFGHGYIDKEGKLDPRYPTGISGYFFYLADGDYRSEQQEWLERQPLWLRLQFVRNTETYISVIMGQIKSGERKIPIGQKLLNHEEFRELDPKIEEKQITWHRKAEEK